MDLPSDLTMSSYGVSVIDRFRESPLYSSLLQKKLVFTVTSGRSGTKLLAVLLSEVLGINAEHEPAPRANFALRPTIDDPNYGLRWLIEEKLPTIAALSGIHYVETSHLYCKGLIEPLLAIGMRPKFIILSRPATEVARSLFQMNVIPGRTESGRLVLLSPEDHVALSLPGWQQFSDYQLCYWYAREIEHRQATYRQLFNNLGIEHQSISLGELVTWSGFVCLGRFLLPDWSIRETAQSAFQKIVSRNQHPRYVAHENHLHDRELPSNLKQQELNIDLVCAPKHSDSSAEKLKDFRVKTEK